MKEKGLSKTLTGICLAIVLVLTLSIVIACSPAPAPAPTPPPAPTPAPSGAPALPPGFTSLKIASGSVGGDFYAYAEALAKVLNSKLGINAEAQPTAGSVENVRLLRDGLVDIAPVSAHFAGYLRNGVDMFSDDTPYPGFRALSGIFTFTGTAIALKKSGITNILDLKGKKFKFGPGPSPAASDSENRPVWEAHGFDYDAIDKIYASTDELYRMLAEGRIDVLENALGGLQAEPGFQELVASYEVVTIEYDKKMMTDAGLDVVFLPKGAFPGVEKDQWGYLWATVGLIATNRLPDDAAYLITKVVHENLAELAELTPAAREAMLNQRLLTTDLPVVYHPGAVRYWADVGEWGKY